MPVRFNTLNCQFSSFSPSFDSNPQSCLKTNGPPVDFPEGLTYAFTVQESNPYGGGPKSKGVETKRFIRVEMLKCPKCGTRLVRQSARRGLHELFLSTILIYPFRCQLCTHRFRTFIGKPGHIPRREYERIPVKCPVPFRSIFSKEPSTEAHGTVVNLSIRGCSIDSNVPLPKGARLRLKFLIADGEQPLRLRKQ